MMKKERKLGLNAINTYRAYLFLALILICGIFVKNVLYYSCVF